MTYHIIFVIIALLSISSMSYAADTKLELTYPAGKSPKVFTTGWVFGARCTVGGKDISKQVEWSGTGKFSPAKGAITHPTFSSAGKNTIKLRVKVDGKEVSRSFAITTVSPANYAALGDTVFCPADSHGCAACPHSVTGHIESGSPNVLVRGKPAARVGDNGHHSTCCGPNTFKITSGDSGVLINGKPAARNGDATLHCGGKGNIGKSGGKQADGKYTGATTPALCKGSLVLTINGSTVTGTYSGGSPVDKSVSIATKWTGTYNSMNSRITGKVTGSSGSSKKRIPLGGSFQGNVGADGISGVWYVSFEGETASASFSLNRTGR
ncbi:MAG: PAAR domain-containing protein [Armatimonadota bacterium]